jgi:hypothetical protein
LSGQYQKGSSSFIGGIANGYLSFLHGFSRALCTFAGARLISSARIKLAKDGSFANHKLVLLLVIDQGPDYVRRQQVGRKLYAMNLE